MEQPKVSRDRGVMQMQVEDPLVEIQAALIDDIVGREYFVSNGDVPLFPSAYGPLDLGENEAPHLQQSILDLVDVCKESLTHGWILPGAAKTCDSPRLVTSAPNPCALRRPGYRRAIPVGRYARGVTETPMSPVLAALARPRPYCLVVLFLIVAGLGLDRYASLGWQHVLGLCTTVVLLATCLTLTPERRAQVAVVVIVATTAELLGSTWWGVYDYRLGNLPLFVPAGHGLVYISGLRLSETDWVRRNPQRLVGIAIAGAIAWGIAGLTVLPRLDVAGAMGVATLVIFLIVGRAPTVYAGVFLTVAFLEIYGTWVGTWAWKATIPGLGIPDGNPPSGAASGYVLFDICALALAPRLLAFVRSFRRDPAQPESVEV